MVSRIFISWICHFWARFWLNFNFGDFRAYFGYFSLVKIDFFEIYFQSWRIKLRVLKFFRPILIIKRHQKNTQAKLFEKFASRQHALVDNQLRWYKWSIQKTQDRYHLFRQITEKRIWAQKTNNQVKGWMREFRSPASLFQKASWLGFFVFVLVFLSEFVLVFVLWTVSSGGLHWIGKNIYVFVVVFLYFLC